MTRQVLKEAQEREAMAATVQAYVLWLEERDAVRDAYERWAGGSSWGPALAFSAFLEALDREESASHVYEMVLREGATDASAAVSVVRRRYGRPQRSLAAMATMTSVPKQRRRRTLRLA